MPHFKWTVPKFLAWFLRTPLFGFPQFSTYDSKVHAKIILISMQESVLHTLFNTAENLDYVGPYPDPKLYEADYISGYERAQYLEVCEEQKHKVLQ